MILRKQEGGVKYAQNLMNPISILGFERAYRYYLGQNGHGYPPHHLFLVEPTLLQQTYKLFHSVFVFSLTLHFSPTPILNSPPAEVR